MYRDFPDNLNTKKVDNTQKEYTIKEIVEATKNIDPEMEKKMQGNYTTEEILEATKNIDPDIWKN